ncbi:MAG: ribonuclease III [Dongiaceae bacterium]
MTSAASTAAAETAASLADALGHRFDRPALLAQALTHPSVASARRRGKGAALATEYERLEFLGDRVLGLVVAELLYRSFPGESEGALAQRLAGLVRQDSLARVAGAIGLAAHLALSRGEADGGGRDNPSLLADACEAVIGAVYLDGGLAPAARFIGRYWRPLMEAEASPPQDAKTALQEWAQGLGLKLPVYETVARDGPPHAPLFAVELRVEGQPPVVGHGRSKREAERAAAAALLDRLNVHG